MGDVDVEQLIASAQASLITAAPASGRRQSRSGHECNSGNVNDSGRGSNSESGLDSPLSPDLLAPRAAPSCAKRGHQGGDDTNSGSGINGIMVRWA